MRNLKYFIYNVFTSKTFGGNPLAIVIDDLGLSTEEMQKIAFEFGLSETIFLKEGDHECDAKARIFTPSVELPMAGHPTVGAAFAIDQLNLFPIRDLNEIKLKENIGVVSVYKEELNNIKHMTMVQTDPKILSNWTDIADLAYYLNVEPSDIDRNYPIQQVTTGVPYWIVPFTSQDGLEKAKANDEIATPKFLNGSPTFLLFYHHDYGADKLIDTRMLASGIGISEDPATGSAQGPLAFYLNKVGLIQTNKYYRVTQGVKMQRPSEIFIKVNESENESISINVSGSAVKFAEGTFYF